MAITLDGTTGITAPAMTLSGNLTAENVIVTGIENVGALNVTGDVSVVGNLTVQGTSFTANVASLVVTDPILGLGRGANGDPLTTNDGLDRGVEMFYYTTAEQIAFVGYDNDAGKMIIASNVSVANNLVTVNAYGTATMGDVELGNILNTNANGVGNIGNATGFFNTIFAQATSAQYADVAEKYSADQDYAPGTVLEIGGSSEVTKTTAYASTRMVGVVTTDPAFIMNSGLKGDHVATVTLLGRVPCRVAGTIKRGDLLTSSNLPGVATALLAEHYRPGCVIGKALQDYNSQEQGIIEVIVGRL